MQTRDVARTPLREALKGGIHLSLQAAGGIEDEGAIAGTAVEPVGLLIFPHGASTSLRYK